MSLKKTIIDNFNIISFKKYYANNKIVNFLFGFISKRIAFQNKTINEQLLLMKNNDIANKRWRNVFEEAAFLIGILDPQGNLLNANKTAFSKSGAGEHDIGTFFPDTSWWKASKSRDQLIESLNLAKNGISTSFRALHPHQEDFIEVDFFLRPVFEDQQLVWIIAEGHVNFSKMKVSEKTVQDVNDNPIEILNDLSATNKISYLKVTPTLDFIECSKSWTELTSTSILDTNWQKPFRGLDLIKIKNYLNNQDNINENSFFSLNIFLAKSNIIINLQCFPLFKNSIFNCWVFLAIDSKWLPQDLHAFNIAETILKNAKESIIITDINNCILRVNPAFELLSGYKEEELIGKNPKFFKSGSQDADFYKKLWQDLSIKGHWSGEFWNKKKDGSIYCSIGTLSKIDLEDAKATGAYYVGHFSDITEFKHAQAEIASLAWLDRVTSLFNRQAFYEKTAAVTEKLINESNFGCLILCDINGFREVNDSLGFEVGDDLLRSCANKILSIVSEKDICARFGGDDFAVFLPEIDLNEAKFIANKLKNILTFEFKPLEGHSHFNISASFGAAFFPSDAKNINELFQKADAALRISREKQTFIEFHDPALAKASQEQQVLQEALYNDCLNKNILIYFQPKWNLLDNYLLGSEALARWRHNGQMISPGVFVPLAENAGFDDELGRCMLLRAAMAACRFSKEAPELLPISVNISAYHLKCGTLFDDILNTLKISGAKPEWLEIELTESAWVDGSGEINQQLIKCVEIGVDFSIDDFGTGYSNLSYLKRLPAKTLKIDQSFIRSCSDNLDDQAIVRAICSIANSLNKKIVAEGVETVDQKEILIKLGANIGQGYLVSKPVPIDQVIVFANNFNNKK